MAVETVTKRNAPLVIHVPDMEVVSRLVESERPDVLRVLARFDQPADPWVMDTILGETEPEITRQEQERKNEYARYLERSKSVSRVLPREAVIDFVGDKSHPPIDVHEFVQKYGLFHWDPPDSLDLPVPENFLENRFRVRISAFKSERERFRRLVQMVSRLSASDPDVATAREIAVQLELPYADDPAKALSIAIGARLNLKVEFALDRSLQKVILKCSDVLSGLYAWLLNAIITNAGWSACPRCGSVFVSAGKRKFCDSRCERADKQKRYRDRKATQKAKGKGRRKVR